MVSPLQSVAAGIKAPNTAMGIGNILRQQAVADSSLKTQDLQRQNIQQQMGMRERAGQQASKQDALANAQYINRLGKQLLSVPESQWGQILEPNLPQLQQIGYTPEILQGMTREQVAGVVQQTDAMFAQQQEQQKAYKLGENEKLVSGSGEEIARGMERAESPKSPKDTQPMVDKLRSRYDNFTKDLRQVDAAYRKVKSAPETAPGDMSLIFGFMKLLDPGSTVREGEFASAEQATGVPQRIVNLYNRALNGERLNEDQRKEFKATAESTFSAQRDSADAQIATLLQQADQDGVSRARVLGAEGLRSFEKRAADKMIRSGSENIQNEIKQLEAEIFGG
jgi:hypothetical protein